MLLMSSLFSWMLMLCEHLTEEERAGLSSCCHVVVSAMCLFLAVHWVGLHFMVVAVPYSLILWYL